MGEHTSPPDRLVGIVISGTTGSFILDGKSVLSTEYRASWEGLLMSFARA